MLARYIRAVERIFRRETAPAQVKQVLFLEYRLPLGCCVHLSPVFEALRTCYPQLRIALATRGLGTQVHRYSPFLDHLIETPDPLIDLRSSISSLRKQLHDLGFNADCVLTGASDQRTRIALLGFFSSAGWRGGYTQQPGLYARPLNYDLQLSLIGNNLRLAKLLGCEHEVHRPRVFFSPQDAQYARELLQEMNPEGRPLMIAVTQNSGGQSTGWHDDRWVQVLRAARSRGLAAVYVGTPTDKTAIHALSQKADGYGASIAGRTTVSQLAAVLALSDLAVTLDTGTMHVGRAVGVPMVILGPSWQKPLEWMPLGVENVRILRGEDRDDVPPGYHLDEIQAESVIAAMDELIALYPPSAESRSRRANDSMSATDRLVSAG